MKIKKQIEENIIKPYSNTKYDMFKATVLSYDDKNNTANIVFHDPNIKANMYLDNVPVQIGSGGVHSSGPFKGDEVWVSFQNSTPLHPKIISLADENYKSNTREKLRHIRKGSLIPFSKSSLKENTPNSDNLSSWLTNSDSYIYKYFKDRNPEEDLENSTSSLFYYGVNDPGMTHPLNSSTIRIRENGAIDIFVNTNEGIRINPKDKSINIYSTNMNISNKSFEFNGDTIDVKASNWTINGKNINIKAEDTLSLECTKLIVKAEIKEGVKLESI